MRLIVGLGNPDKRYRLSRHNLGFMVIDRLAQTHKIRSFWPRFQGRAARMVIGEEQVLLLKPHTYMNQSGQSVVRAMRKYNLYSDQLIVVHDDLDLAPGKIKLGVSLGSAGHKGLESIIESLGTKDFFRVRLGIGKPAGGQDAAEYVLASLSQEEMVLVKPMVERACSAIEVLVTEGIEEAQNLFHASRQSPANSQGRGGKKN